MTPRVTARARAFVLDGAGLSRIGEVDRLGRRTIRFEMTLGSLPKAAVAPAADLAGIYRPPLDP